MILDKMYQTIIDDIAEKVWDKILHKLDEAGIKTNAPMKDLTFEDFVLPTRVVTCLRSENIFTVSELCEWQACQLLSIPNLGRKGLRCIEEELARYGLKLGQ